MVANQKRLYVSMWIVACPERVLSGQTAQKEGVFESLSGVARSHDDIRPRVYTYTDAKHVYIMSDADTAGGEDGPETVQINLRLTRAFLDDIDATWEEQGFNSRSEFLRYAARDAVKHPEFSREGWKQIAASEHDLRSGEAELVSRDEVRAMMDRDANDE